MTTTNILLSELEDVISQGSVARRIEALNHLTNTFLSASVPYSDAQIAVLDEIFVRLSAEIESAARQALAARLADVQRAPLKVIRALAEDDAIEVAQPILSRSECLDEKALIEIVTTKNQEYLLAVSTRKSLGTAVTDVLVNRGDRAVVHSTARNTGAKFSDAGYGMLVERAHDDDELAECVGSRADIPRYLFLEIVKKASDAVRTKLEKHQPNFASEIQRFITEVTGVIRMKSAYGSRNYAAAEVCVRSLQAAGRLGANEVETFAKAGQFEETTVTLAIMGNMPIEVVERAMVQEGVDLLLIIARAIDLSWSATKSVLFLRSGALGLSSVTIEQYLSNFERMKPSTAQQIIRFYLLRGLKSA